MENKEQEIVITPEQALADFMLKNKFANRHERRAIKKMMGITIPTSNKPYVKEEKRDQKNTLL